MVLIHFLVSFVASVVGAISGIGGGVIIKPTLDFIGLQSPTTISFLSATTVLAMTTVTLMRNKNTSIKLDKKISTIMAVGGVLGGFLGKYVFNSVHSSFPNEAVIGATQSIILLILTLGVLITSLLKSKIHSLELSHWSVSFMAGLALGAISTFLGIGGGPFNLTVLYLLFSMDSKTAALNSIFIIFFSQLTNLILTVVTGYVPEFSVMILVSMIIGGITGGLAGIFFSKRMTNRQVDYLFICVTIIIIATSFINFTKYMNQI